MTICPKHGCQKKKQEKPENGGSEEKLSKEQAEALGAHLEKYIYLYVKDIIAYVQMTFNTT